MKTVLMVIAASLLAGAGWTQSPIIVTIPSGPVGPVLPPDFLGLSFGSKTLPPDKTGARFFSATNTPLITLFQNLGIRHLRLGGTSVESPPTNPIPDTADIDSLFTFVKAAQVRKVIYSLRLLETRPGCEYAATNAMIAKYIWDHYRPYLDCFAIGNEPDRRNIYDQDLTITNFEIYLAKWRQFASAITSAVPQAKFAGPDAGSGNIVWTTNFAHAEKNVGIVQVIAEHFYVGGGGRSIPAAQSIASMLSPDWIARNQKLYDRMALPVLAAGFPYRFTEANDHFQGGTPDASNTFAGALWALDFLHWWAAHGTRGVDFHNTQWVVNDIITSGPDGRLTINPKGYALKAFELSSHGSTLPATISNPDDLNLTAYAARGQNEYFVTLINKEHGPGARKATVTLATPEPVSRASAIFLAAPNGDAAAKTGVTLGGAPITADGPWLGQWTMLAPAQSGRCMVILPAASAVIVRTSRK